MVHLWRYPRGEGGAMVGNGLLNILSAAFDWSFRPHVREEELFLMKRI